MARRLSPRYGEARPRDDDVIFNQDRILIIPSARNLGLAGNKGQLSEPILFTGQLPYRVQSSDVPSPFDSDFGPDSLTDFVYDQLCRNMKKEVQLRQNPDLAAAEKEIRDLRWLVNGGKHVTVRTTNGRLVVSAVDPLESHSTSTSRRQGALTEGSHPVRSESSNGTSEQEPRKHRAETTFPLSSVDRVDAPLSNIHLPSSNDIAVKPTDPQTDLSIMNLPSSKSLSGCQGDHNQRVAEFEQHTTSQRQRLRDNSFSTRCMQPFSGTNTRAFRQSGSSILGVHEAHDKRLPSFVCVEGQSIRPSSSNDSNVSSVPTGSLVQSRNLQLSTDDISAPSLAKEDSSQDFESFVMTTSDVAKSSLFDPALINPASFCSAAADLVFDDLRISNQELDTTKQSAGHTKHGKIQTQNALKNNKDGELIYEDESDQHNICSEDGIERSPDKTGDGGSSLVPEQLYSGAEDDVNPLLSFPYHKVVPEFMPLDIRKAKLNCRKIWAAVGMNPHGKADPSNHHLWNTTQYTMEDLNPQCKNHLGAVDADGGYPRMFLGIEIPSSPAAPPECPARCPREKFPTSVWPTVTKFLSSQEVRNLRLINKATAIDLAPYMLRSAVVKFSKGMFNMNGIEGLCNSFSTLFSDSMFQKYGQDINKFGISFEYSPPGLAHAPSKAISKNVNKWFGSYTWPKETYPRFKTLQELDDLVDVNSYLLKDAMSYLTKASELGLSIDSGHGWLNGPDNSDLALYKERTNKGTKVFGTTFDAEDRLAGYALRQYFKWAQVNTVTACAKKTASNSTLAEDQAQRLILQNLEIREYDSYLVQSLQPDCNLNRHTGGIAIQPAQNNPLPTPSNIQPYSTYPIPMVHPPTTVQISQMLSTAAALPQPTMPIVFTNQANMNMGDQYQSASAHPTPGPAHQSIRVAARNAPSAKLLNANALTSMSDRQTPRSQKIYPQWPLIFNCHNLSANLGGHTDAVQDNVAPPATCPIHPRNLTEAQAQWLMETLWAQRNFLALYSQSIIANSEALKGIHSLHIAKISSGLLDALEHKHFWTALKGLNNLTLMVIPDWRQEHIIGDSQFSENMRINPVDASHKFNDFLKHFIAPLEGLSKLTIGFIGGGEHATGMYARNSHVLPAPISTDAIAWLFEHRRKPDANAIAVFNHIQDLKFVNCWFTPTMLKTFLDRSKDTSLHHLTLDSVSLTGKHTRRRIDHHLTIQDDKLRCEFRASEWLHEDLPSSACWVRLINSVTPGQTILDRKYDAEMINEIEQPRREKGFRGNIQTITLNSCGYVKILGVDETDFNQNELVIHGRDASAFDEGLRTRADQFFVRGLAGLSPFDPTELELDLAARGAHVEVVPRGRSFQRRLRTEGAGSDREVKIPIMMDTRDPETGRTYLGLGQLTSCVHPVEKRVLEQAWGMEFGWGDIMERFGAVEDGHFEGGVGRFGGVIRRDE